MLRFGIRIIKVAGNRRYINNNFIDVLTKIPSLRTLHSQPLGINNKSTEVSTTQVDHLINSIQNLGFDEDEIKKVIQNKPDLVRKSPTAWSNILESLVNFGFENKDVLSIFEKWPQILSLKKSELDRNLAAWLRCGLGEELTYELLTTHPNLLQLNELFVEKRIKQYQLYFETRRGVGQLLLKAPNILEENEDELFDKLNYLNELCTEKSEIISTGALAYSAFHIKARHEFLIRAGVYKRPGKHFNKRLSKNPKLRDILHSSDKEFASKSGLSLLEFEVFLEMFEKEREESIINDLEDEDELNRAGYGKHRKVSKR